MKKIKTTSVFFLICSLTLFVNCKKEKNAISDDPGSSFDKSGMLNNIGGNLILPAYVDCQIGFDSLKYYSDSFIANPSLKALQALQNSFKKANAIYQNISTFEFGPADSELLRANFNTFPCDTTQINNKIVTGNLTMNTVADLDTKGFPAIDFLLFRNNQDNNYILSRFKTDSTASNTKNYLNVLVSELKSKTDKVLSAWSASGGNYLSAFKANTGSDVGGSIGMLVNQLNFDFELLKNAKVGIPLGKKTLGTPLPEKVEAYYSGQSLVLLLEHLKAIENVYLGRSAQNIDGLGLDDYLTHIDAQHTSGSLNAAIKNKFAAAKTKVAAIPESLSQSVLTNATLVDAAYAELQQLVVLLKVDLPSALGVLITYQDNDGD